MNRKQIILDLRTSRKIKGRMPGVIFLKYNKGEIYKGSQADFVISLTDKFIHFQRLSFFLKKLKPEKDFKIARDTIKSYNLRDINIVIKCLTLYTVDRRYIEINYNFGLADNVETVDNINRIIKELVASGVKESRL